MTWDEATHPENRIGGGASNSYLLMVACVAAGMEGLRNHLKLLAPVARIAYGLEGMVDLPIALDEVVEALEPDAALQAVPGPELVRLAVEIRRYELNKAKAALSDSGTPEFSQRVDDGEHHESVLRVLINGGYGSGVDV